MNILILGGAGFLGSNLTRRCLQDKRNSVVVVDSLDSRIKSTIKNLGECMVDITFIQGDICDRQLMKKVVKGKDVIFNCAAQTSHSLSFKDPFFDVEVNCKGNINLLETVRKYNKDVLLIYSSSSTLVGKAMSDVIDEQHSQYPLDIYSANKGVAEKYYYIYNKVYGLKTISLRFANLYGPYGKRYSEFGFINYFIALAEADKVITLYGDGSQIRNILFVQDAAELLYQCIKQKSLIGDIYFAVGHKHYSIKQIAQEIVSIFGRGSIINVEWPNIKKKIEVGNVLISGAKLYSKIGWRPRYGLRAGLLKTKEIIEK